MGIICGKCTKCLDLWLADTAGGFPPSRRCVFILLHPGLYYSSEEPMNILKANRAINPSKINLSEEMLHFYFRAQSRPRHGLRPRSALRAVPAGAGSVSPPRGRECRLAGHAWELPPALRTQHRAQGHREGASGVSCPRGKRHPLSDEGETTFPRAGRGNAPFRTLQQCVGTSPSHHRPAPGAPPCRQSRGPY